MSEAVKAKEKVKDAKPNLDYLRDKDREKVRGMFRFFEVPGGSMQFSFRKYKKDEVETFTLVDGEIYTLPRGVAHHLSNNCWYPESSYKMDASGNKLAIVAKKRRRCTFEPLEFMDIDDINDLRPVDLDVVTSIAK